MLKQHSYLHQMNIVNGGDNVFVRFSFVLSVCGSNMTSCCHNSNDILCVMAMTVASTMYIYHESRTQST